MRNMTRTTATKKDMANDLAVRARAQDNSSTTEVWKKAGAVVKA